MATIHSKLCECGCGEPSPVYQRNDPKRGHVKGQPARFIAGHNLSPNPGPRHARAGDRPPHLFRPVRRRE